MLQDMPLAPRSIVIPLSIALALRAALIIIGLGGLWRLVRLSCGRDFLCSIKIAVAIVMDNRADVGQVGPRNNLWGPSWPCMVWPIACKWASQCSMALLQGPQTWPKLLCWKACRKFPICCLLHLKTVSWQVHKQWQVTVRPDLYNYHKIRKYICLP